MGVDGVERKVERLGDLALRQALVKQSKHLQFSFGQRSVSRDAPIAGGEALRSSLEVVTEDSGVGTVVDDRSRLVQELPSLDRRPARTAHGCKSDEEFRQKKRRRGRPPSLPPWAQ